MSWHRLPRKYKLPLTPQNGTVSLQLSWRTTCLSTLADVQPALRSVSSRGLEIKEENLLTIRSIKSGTRTIDSGKVGPLNSQTTAALFALYTACFRNKMIRIALTLTVKITFLLIFHAKIFPQLS